MTDTLMFATGVEPFGTSAGDGASGLTGFISTSEYLFEWLPELWFGLLILSLGGYLLLDGFDFGIGVLFVDADDHTREYLLAAFGPVWKANEVWLVFFGTVLFAGFPAVYGNLFSRHYVLAFCILVALTLRGLGSKLREERDDTRWVRFWDRCFVVGSAGAPVLLGMFVGSWMLGTETAFELGPVAVGLTVLALTVVLGSAYFAVKTAGDLRTWALRRGQQATVGYVALFVVTAGAAYPLYPAYQSTIVSVPTLAIVLTTVVGALGFLWTARNENARLVFVSGATMAVALVAFVAHMLYPVADPAVGLTIRDAIVSPLPLNISSLVAALFVPIIVVYFTFLYTVFRGPARPSDGYT